MYKIKIIKDQKTLILDIILDYECTKYSVIIKILLHKNHERPKHIDIRYHFKTTSILTL